MAENDTITIDKTELGPVEPEFGIYADDLKLFDKKQNKKLVKVFVDGRLFASAAVTEQSITIPRPHGAYGEPSTVVVTTNRDEILNVLRYDGDKKIEIKDPPDEEATLKDIAKAIAKIAEAMPPAKTR
jgi:hypothetical protein